MYAVLMAGGSGTRFWPLSRRRRPKQLLSIVGKETMLQQTMRRLGPLVPLERTLVVTTQEQAQEVRSQLPRLPKDNLIAEPVGRSTAPCVGLGAAIIAHREPQAVMALLPADHVISHEERFRNLMRVAADKAAEGTHLITLGMTPTRPETGYGYIRVGERVESREGWDIFQVDRFVEKPHAARAKRFLASGGYLWNSGMFICRVDRMLAMIEVHLPEVHSGLQHIVQAFGKPAWERVLKEHYAGFPAISLDHGVAEREKHVLVVPAELGWSDVGSWGSLLEVCSKTRESNVVVGEHVGFDTSECIIHGSKRLIATIGLKRMVVVDTEDALLICPLERDQDVRHLVEELRRRKMSRYL